MNIKKMTSHFAKRFVGQAQILNEMKSQHENAAVRSGQVLESIYTKVERIKTFKEIEFKVFSQWGDDGIIAWLSNHLKFENSYFVEFGVQNYEESNTRFLLMRQNSSGLVMDGNRNYIEYIKNDPLFWKYDLNVQELFITAENIDIFLTENCSRVDVDLLSIDIDGNDYWIFKAIESIRPKIVVCEFNSLFGADLEVTIPYGPQFERGRAHYSHLYFGASIQALIKLGSAKGYGFVGTNSNGNNAYFVRNDLSHLLAGKIEKPEIYLAKFRESRDRDGRLNFLSAGAGLKEIKELELHLLSDNRVAKIGDIYSLN